jgi:hypothetical protein
MPDADGSRLFRLHRAGLIPIKVSDGIGAKQIFTGEIRGATLWSRVMPESHPQTENLPLMPDLFPAGFTESGKKRVRDLINLQAELFKYCQEANQNWFARMQTEVALASKFSTKLAAARSIPETGAACQEWANRHIELLAEDAKRLVADTEKVFETGVRVFANGWASDKSEARR